MSLKSYAVACDWPGCSELHTFDLRDSSADCGWGAGVGISGRHLCPEHSSHSWTDWMIASALAELQQKGALP